MDDPDEARLATVPLPAAGRQRAAAFRADVDRRRFLGVRLLLHEVVAAVTDADPHQVVLHQHCARCGGEHGRPAVTVAGRPGPHVSLAHGGGLVVVAVGPVPVGVDVEPQSAADRLPPGVDLAGWVRREAVLKALGLGVDVDPDPIGPLPPGPSPRLERWPAPGPRPRLHVTELAATAGPDAHLLAVATVGPQHPVDAGPT